MERKDAAMDELTVGELAARSGVSVSALHFFERQKLISSRRTAGNQRRYRRDTLRRVALIRIAQRVGIPLAKVAEVLAVLPGGCTPNRADWQRLAQSWQDELDQRMRHLQQLRDEFTDCVGCGCLSIDRCPMINPHDRMGVEGPGPRRLLGPRVPVSGAACGVTDCSPAGPPMPERPTFEANTRR
jgi:MerR family transcriptional regulator, redox-sensitive transcriptional activator SoxR